MVNTAGCGPVMRGFDPHRPPHIRTGNRHRRFFYARAMGINGTCRKNKKEEMTWLKEAALENFVILNSVL